jgi:acyl-CoA thioester hydrolase
VIRIAVDRAHVRGEAQVVTAGGADIDELDHVSNVAIVRWIQDVAAAHSIAGGWPFARYQALGAAFMIRRHEVDYLGQVRLGEQVACETWVETWSAASSVRRTDLRRLGDERVVARASTTWVLVRLRDGRPQRIPDELRAAFG